jgi:hypothetical protein
MVSIKLDKEFPMVSIKLDKEFPEDWDKYLSWKNRLASTGVDVSNTTYKEFEGCKLRHFVRVNTWWPQADYNEWNW